MLLPCNARVFSLPVSECYTNKLCTKSHIRIAQYSTPRNDKISKKKELQASID